MSSKLNDVKHKNTHSRYETELVKQIVVDLAVTLNAEIT